MIEWYKALYFHMVEGSPENTVGKMPVDFVARITGHRVQLIGTFVCGIILENSTAFLYYQNIVILTIG